MGYTVPGAAKIGAALPKTAEANGLHAIATSLLTEPHEVRYAIVVLDCGKVTTEYKFDDMGERYTEVIPHARVRAIEPIKGDDERAVRHLMTQARDERLGRPTLPLDFNVGDVTGSRE